MNPVLDCSDGLMVYALSAARGFSVDCVGNGGKVGAWVGDGDSLVKFSFSGLLIRRWLRRMLRPSSVSVGGVGSFVSDGDCA